MLPSSLGFSCQRHRIAIEARLYDLFLLLGEIAQPFPHAIARLGIDVLAVPVCAVPVKELVALPDGLHFGWVHSGIVTAGTDPVCLIVGHDAAADFPIVAAGISKGTAQGPTERRLAVSIRLDAVMLVTTVLEFVPLAIVAVFVILVGVAFLIGRSPLIPTLLANQRILAARATRGGTFYGAERRLVVGISADAVGFCLVEIFEVRKVAPSAVTPAQPRSSSLSSHGLSST
jgi:hypothetical protein